MYTLRTVNSNGTQHNQLIGEQYHYIDRFVSYEEFCGFFKECFQKDHVADLDPKSDDFTKRCFAFLNTSNGIYPLYQNERYYVMSPNGQTFEKIYLV